MTERTLRGKVAVVGIGETPYYKHSQSPDPEFVLALKAILAACADAGINPQDVDSFASYSNDRNDPSRARPRPAPRPPLRHSPGSSRTACSAR